MPQSATAPLRFAPSVPMPVEADFLGERLTSDGGLVWLEEADRALGLCAAFAAAIPDWRRRRARHDLGALVRQRVFQLACGYEDQADADALRGDPLLKLACGRLPDGDPDLASQPTLSRLENAVSATACYRLAAALGEVYRRERERDGVPARVVLDLDGTDDPAHGEQEGSAYHGYYRQRQYFPLLVSDGETGQLVAAVLRPGTAHAGHGAVAVLGQVVPRLRAWWPEVAIEVRADSGFARPEVYAFCEAARLTYTIGLVGNPRLERLAAPLRAQAERERDARGEKVRLVGEAPYRADSWPHERRVVFKAEALERGPNTRFVVTNRAGEAAAPRSTSGTSTAGRPRAGSRTSSAPASPTGSPATASSPTSSASCSARRRTGCSTRCAGGWPGSASPAPNSTPSGSACSRSAAACARGSTACACAWRPATQANRSGTSSPTARDVHE
jgi:hypothetical protein